MSDRARRGDAPGDLILEPNERVLLATRPLFLWEPLVLIDILLAIVGVFSTSEVLYARSVLIVAALILFMWIVVKWIPGAANGSCSPTGA